MAGPLDLERQFTESQSLAHVGSWEWDTSQERVWWSAEMCRIAGREPGYAPTYPEMLDYLHPEDRAEHVGQLTASPGDFDYRIVRADGVVRHIHGYRRARYGAAGTLTHLYGVVQDITERHEAEAEARQERDHAQAIIAAMHEGYALTVDGEITAVNDALCEMLGYREDELVGMRLPFPFWPADQRYLTVGARARALAAGRATTDVVLLRRDATRFEVELKSRVALRAGGEVIGIVHTVRDVSESNRLRRELEHRARTDSLTGIANRYVLNEAMAQEAGRHARGQTLALVLLDLDLFKQVNDRHGHPVGDAVLTETARRLTAIARDGEALARVGGEEFAWLLPDCDGIGARAMAERARAAVGGQPFPTAGSLTMSAGIAVMEIPCDVDELYALADRALYDAKQAGRDRVRCRAKPGELLDPSGRRAGDPSETGTVDGLLAGGLRA